MRDLPKHPAVDWPAQQNAHHHGHSHVHGAHAAPSPSTHVHDEACVETSPKRSEGLRIRIK
jgi:hypothetical protein